MQLMADNEVYRYADWEVRPRERALRVRGELQKVGARAFDVLLALIRHGDRVMSRADLLDAAWPGLVVEENNLSVQISTLRRLLGPSSIVNIAGLGYRLAAAPADAPSAPLDTPAPDRPATARALALAPATGLIGRDDEIDSLLPRLATAPLVTIVGTGGVGKSSLARALLAVTDATWRDGVHWIDLEALPSGTDLLALVGRSLGVVMDEDGLASGDVLRSLSRLSALVVLDNCEHLIADVTRCVAPLLRAAPSIRWLATSQEPLHLPGEEVFRLLPLHVASAEATVDEATSCGALALLRQRAQAADRTFAIDATNVALALDLCRAFDGLPLAIEMAAARVATLGLGTVHAQLNRPMTLRSGLRASTPRHHTLRQAYEWSHGLLSVEEQRLFRRLQPFQGGFTTALLERFLQGLPESGDGMDGDDAIDLLAALVDKSLVQKMPAGEPGTVTRYRLLESARSFAWLQLQLHGDTNTVVVCHAQAVALWFDNAEEDWQRWRDAQWSAHYVPERDNVIAAATWACACVDCPPDLLARLLAAAAQHETFVNGKADVFRYAVPIDRLSMASSALRARAYSGVGWAQFLDGDAQLGGQLLEQALADYDALRDLSGAYLVLTRLIRAYRAQPDKRSSAAELWARLAHIDPSEVPLRLRIYADATVARHFDPRVGVEQLVRMERTAQQAGFDSQAIICRVHLTDQLLLHGRYAEVVETAEQAPAHDRQFLRLHAMLDHNTAHALVRLDRMNEAHRALRRMLRAVPSDTHLAMDLYAFGLAQAGQLENAALLAGRSAQIKRGRHCGSEPAEATLIADTLTALHSGLAAAELTQLLELGASMPSNDILAIADPLH